MQAVRQIRHLGTRNLGGEIRSLVSHAERMLEAQLAGHVEFGRDAWVDADRGLALRGVHVGSHARRDVNAGRWLELQRNVAARNGVDSSWKEPRVVRKVQAATIGLEPEAIDAGVESGLQCRA